MERVIPHTHAVLGEVITEEDTVIDATAGNGHDTVFLAGISRHVHAFDVQKQAIENTKHRLETHGFDNVTLHTMGHEHLDKVEMQPYKAVVFNLGYLPGGDRTLTTKRATSLEAIKKAMEGVLEGGLVTVTLYPGHPEGKEEATLIEAFLKTVDTAVFTVLKYQFLNTRDSPYSLIVKKNRKD